jgi:hypothetical protein
MKNGHIGFDWGIAVTPDRFAFSKAGSTFGFGNRGEVATISPVAEKSATGDEMDFGGGKKCEC